MNFDTHAVIKTFKKAGFKDMQAEVIVNAINQSREFDISRLATKEQIIILESSTKERFIALESSIKEQFSKIQEQFIDLENRNKQQFLYLEARMAMLENKIDWLEEKLSAQMKAEIKEATITNLKWMFAMLMPLYAGILGTLVKVFF